MSINWFPGHMVRARREIEENLKLVDIVVLLLDARAPFSCRNPKLEEMVARKPLIMVLNKYDLGSAEYNKRYLRQFKELGLRAVGMDSITGKGHKQVLQEIEQAFAPQAEKLHSKGRRIRPARVMVAGVPNTGKSTFLNYLVGRKSAATGSRPGITRGKQWVRVREDIEFLDTPGIMWPKIEDPQQGLKLALLDIVGENAYDIYEIGLFLLKVLKDRSPQILKEKFALEDLSQEDSEILREISIQRGHLLRQGETDLDKTAHTLVQDFRKGRLGKLSLD